MPHQALVEDIQKLYDQFHLQDQTQQQPLLEKCITNKNKLALLFAGQGFDFMAELAELYAFSPKARDWIIYADRLLTDWIERPDVLSKGMFTSGLHLVLWLQESRTLPQSYLRRVSVSHPLIFIAQVARLLFIQEQGFSKTIDNNNISIISGYSQGMIPALLTAEQAGDQFSIKRAGEYLQYTFWQGVIMENHWQRLNQKELSETTPMAGISGLSRQTLEAAIKAVAPILEDGEELTIAIQATRTRFVVSGPSPALEQLSALLEKQRERYAQKKKNGQFGGNVPAFTWETVPVRAAFHNQMMKAGIAILREKCIEMGFSISSADLKIPIIRYDDACNLSKETDPLEYLMSCQFVLPVEWFAVMSRVAHERLADIIIDLGPGDGLARLCASTLRGTGIETIPMSTPAGQQRLFTLGAPAPKLLNYDSFRPRLIKGNDGTFRVDNAFTQATGSPPIILPGMTPTTSDVPIVAAAANAGYVSELAGGGQVNEDIFWKRMEELRAQLTPGRGAVFNALFLDRYLWDLHFGKHNLVIKARQAGYPICGVTISAGIPETEEAVTLFRNFHRNGIWLNALKAGNVAQVKQIIQIAKALPEQKIFLHLEGGKAGGHHSWEDLDQLLLDTYHLVRGCPNLVLCVGGGIANESRSTELLLGKWASKYGLIDMPVDAIFLGTICMAVLEAKTSPQVKQALVDAAGTPQWVYAGSTEGQMTSGKSQLNADIHYVDNWAARCGRLLDSVAGNAEAVAENRAEIINVLNHTAKPYFGDVHNMTYANVLRRMIELMAIGRYDTYEDGCWPDISFRERFADMLWRTESRLHSKQEGLFTSVLSHTDELDHPKQVLEQFIQAYPEAEQHLLHPSDSTYFLSNVCRRPGKPVNFVPVIDADVRRWYKSDSLWFSHDDRFSAEQVLIIPGPEAVAGIQKIDEPISELFGRFQQHVCKNIEPDSPQEKKDSNLHRMPLNSFIIHKDGSVLSLTLTTDNVDWFDLFPMQSDIGVFAFWNAAQILCGDRLEANILRMVCPPQKGGILEIGQNGLRCSPFADRNAWVSLEEKENGAIEIQIFDEDLTGTSKPLMSQQYRPRTHEGEALFRIEDDNRSVAVMELYHKLLFQSSIAITPLFSTATEAVSFTEKELRGYLSSLGERGTLPSLNFMFTLGWKPIFSVLSCHEMRGGLLDLVHLSNTVTADKAWPPHPMETLQASARIFRVETKVGGQAVSVELTLNSERGKCASLISEFYIRRAPNQAMPKLMLSHERTHTIQVHEKAELALLTKLGFIQWDIPPQLGEELTFSGNIVENHPWNRQYIHQGEGTIHCNNEKRGTYSIDERSTTPEHPLDKLFAVFKKDTPNGTPVRRLATEETCWAPASMAAYAQVSRDQNPIHQSVLFAKLAGLEAPIVHGMWTAGKMHSLLRRSLRDDAQLRIRSFQVFFDAPLPLGGELSVQVWKTGYVDGGLQAEIRAVHIQDGGEIIVARANALVAPLHTAYIFPGQGIQEQHMGMTLFSSSQAARDVWTRADTHTRKSLGFSILRVVQNNPKILRVGRSSFRHPKGVLHLTQFTQVAMATMAQAQVAWMKEEGVFIPSAVTCGHSVGEYNAISAVLQAIPLEEVISAVWHRGLTMHSLVERDEKGRSAYKMGVIRPHYAKLSHQQCEELVANIHESTGHFIEIVNYNVRGRQYSVTGEIPALEALEEALEQQNQSSKKAYIEVPSVDVPFHSRLLTSGVPEFRRTLNNVFPSEIDPKKLVNRYIPNLTATVFRLDPSFLEEILSVVDSAPMKECLNDWDNQIQHPALLCRTILIELLAWQFASPVRWIETQELMFAQSKRGGLGIQEIIEVGSAKQPTLANMASYSLSLSSIPCETQVFNVEREQERLFGIDTPQAAPAAETQAVEPQPQPEVATPTSTPAPAPQMATSALNDQPVTHAQGLQFLISKQANLRMDQLTSIETIEEIFEGVSSKRNQLLLDLGTEFSVGALDAAHEKPLSELSVTLRDRSPSWNLGPYIQANIDDTAKKVFGRASLSRTDIDHQLENEFGLPAGLRNHAWLALVLESREGTSIRGGSLGELTAFPADKGAAQSFLDKWMGCLGSSMGVSIGRQTAQSGGTAVDSALLESLKESIVGEDGILMKSVKSMAEELGHSLQKQFIPEEEAPDAQTLNNELSSDYTSWVKPVFDPKKHAPFISAWAAAHSTAAQLLHQALSQTVPTRQLEQIADRLKAYVEDERILKAVEWNIAQLKKLNRHDLIPLFERSLNKETVCALPVLPSRPLLQIGPNGDTTYQEVEDNTPDAALRFVDSYCSSPHAAQVNGLNSGLKKLLQDAGSFQEMTVLVTGASPGSIAIEIVRQLLRGNARVIVTTTNPNAKRMRFYRDIYNEDAGPQGQLHILPYNQASIQDTDALVEWLFESELDLRPNLILPFGAIKSYGSLAELDARSEASMRAMLTGVERLIAGVGVKMLQEGGGHCHVVLPLSPNHGIFGGDGLYAESKAALEVLLNKCRSESQQWAKHISICGAVIGWVRGTGLMNANNLVAAQLEQQLSIQTFSASEMGLLIAALCQQEFIDQCRPTLRVDLSGGLQSATNLRDVVNSIRTDIEEESSFKQNLHRLRTPFMQQNSQQNKQIAALPFSQSKNPAVPFEVNNVPLSDMVVIVGYGEMGPCGSARTRFEIELHDELAPGAVAELAWITGTIRYENDAWIDTKTSEVIDEADIAQRYRDQMEQCTGIRILKPETLGFDTQSVETWVMAYLDRPYRFTVSSKEEAEGYVAADSEKIQMSFTDGEWHVTMQKGAQIRLPKNIQFSRSVGGAIPDGFDFSRYGIPQDMQESVDRLTLFNFVATVDAWISAGLTPEELMAFIHPARIGNTQSSGIGGMGSLTRLYTDPLLGNERQNDVLQETLLNVMAAYVVQSYVGSYGPMSHPVGACATAALSVESGMEKILLGKADFVVTGGFDDLGIEGMFGFADMNATAPTQDMLDMGLEPKEFSRSNDIRRGGFVESQGGGTLLLARGDIALKVGLPVYGVLACAGSYSDGIHRSIPAPGKGLLAMATGKESSELGRALKKYGLSTDDIGVVYKHDTSTTANDVNENEIHHRIQEHLGRKSGNPLWVVSQKSITGHSKGGAAAWQLIGLCQALAQQRIPGNKNLSCVDPAMRRYQHMCFLSEDLSFNSAQPLRAGLVTSLGFGHVSAGVLVLHPDAFLAAVSEESREEYTQNAQARKRNGERLWQEIRMGKSPAFKRAQHRRFKAKDGTQAQAEEEAQMLLSPLSRLKDGVFQS